MKLNEKFHKAYNDYKATKNEDSFNLMVEMYNSMELKPDEYQPEYEEFFPEMGDSTLFEDVVIGDFLGLHK